MKNITIFIDESGKPEVYSAKGINLVSNGTASKYLVLAAVRTDNQLELLKHVNEFKNTLLNDPKLKSYFTTSYTLEAFHAQTDHLEIKHKFFEFINTLDIKTDVIVVDKLKCYPSLQENPNNMYSVMSGLLLNQITHKGDIIEIIFSRRESKLKIKKDLQAEIDRIRLEFFTKHPEIKPKYIELTYKHNPHYTHAGLQVADYIAHAIYQVFERNNFRYYDLIKNKVGNIRDVCNKKYFTRSNPLQLS